MVLFKINNDINKIKVVHDEKEENLGVTLNQVYNNQLYFNNILNEITDIMNKSTTEEEKNNLLTYLNEQLTNYRDREIVIDSDSYINSQVVEFYEDSDNTQMDLRDKLNQINDLIEDNRNKQENLNSLLSDSDINQIYNHYNNVDNLVKIKEIMDKIDITGDGDLKLMYDINNINFCTNNEAGTEVCKKLKSDSVE